MTMKHKQVIIIRKDLNMRKGKIAAQAAHASMGAVLSEASSSNDGTSLILNIADPRIGPWLTGQFTKICVYVNTEQELLDVYQQAKDAGLISCLIQDSGLTEFGGVKTYTAVAVGPDSGDRIDAICKHLPLY